ncbi:MAG: Gfo/Idh/MocA family oxidoreductase [Planctomycetes bacterium]|nr:Gfo/Idh/MocA family oxidoreductase [Planctomycetota bacterium]
MPEEKKQIRLGFIGCGGHSSATLQPNAHMVAEIQMVAMCDLDAAKAKRAAERWGVNAWYTDLNVMLKEQQLDAVVVCGPPMMMQPLTKEMLGRGLNVFTEKPPAVTAALAKELVDASQASGKVGMVATHWRHSPAYAKARDLMAQPAFGQPSHCQGWFFAPGPTGPLWGANALGGYLLAQGVHLVDCTRSLMGDVAEVSAHGRTTEQAFDSCSVSLKFKSGATGTLSLLARAPYWTGHRVFGTGGGFAEVQNGRDLRCALPPFWTGEKGVDYHNHSFQTWGYSPFIPGYAGAGYMQELQHFAASILAGKQPVASLKDGYEAMRVLEAIRDSAVSGKPMAL